MQDFQLKQLSEEIQKPQYVGMDEKQIADAINVIDVSEPIKSISGIELAKHIDMTDYVKLDSDQKQTLANMMLTTIPLDSGFFKDYLLSIFPVDSPTQINLTTALVNTTSKAKQLGFGKVGEYHVSVAKKIVELGDVDKAQQAAYQDEKIKIAEYNASLGIEIEALNNGK